MSTSAKIIFLNKYPEHDGRIDVKNEDCPMVYVHSDGFPEGLLPILTEYLRTDGAKSRKNDAEYLSAYFLAYSIIRKNGSELSELSDYTQYGITTPNTYANYHYCVANNYGEFTIFICDSQGEVLDITSSKTYGLCTCEDCKRLCKKTDLTEKHYCEYYVKGE